MKTQIALNSLLGVAIGDCLGATYEFTGGTASIPDDIKITGGGAFNVRPGEHTDDTAMMLCILRSLVKLKRFDIKDVADNYLDWYNKDPKDTGMTTRKALKHYRKHLDPYTCGVTDETSLGNGAIMRSSAIISYGVLANIGKETLIEWGNLDCSLTHNNIISKEINEVYLRLLHEIQTTYLDKLEYFEYFKHLVNNYISNSDVISEIYEIISTYFDVYLNNDSEYKFQMFFNQMKDYNSGYSVHTLTSSVIYGLLFDPFTGIKLPVCCGDDADTVAAVTGSIIGSLKQNEGFFLDRKFGNVECYKEICDLIANI